MSYFDTHAHLHACADAPEELVERARQAGVDRILEVGAWPDRWPEVVDFSVAREGVFPILGILSCAFLITRVEARVQLFFFYFLIGAVVAYFLYGIWNSKLGRGQTVTGHEPPPMDRPHN